VGRYQPTVRRRRAAASLGRLPASCFARCTPHLAPAVRARPWFALVSAVSAFALLALAAGCGSPPAGAPTTSPAAPASTGQPTLPAVTPTPPTPTTSPSATPPATAARLRTPSAALPLRLKTYGDSVGGGLAWAMTEKVAAHPLVKLWVFYKPSTGLTRPDYFSWPRRSAQDFAHHSYEVAVFMSGANDDHGMTAAGHDLPFGSKTWLAEYHRRVGALMDLLLKDRVKRLYWVGMPHMAGAAFGRLMKTIDGVYRQEAARRAPSVVYIDSWRILDGRNGAYEGRLRQPDGVHLAPSGSFRLADAVYRIIEKDWRIR
jgi:uncharacterized protein